MEEDQEKLVGEGGCGERKNRREKRSTEEGDSEES